MYVISIVNSYSWNKYFDKSLQIYSSKFNVIWIKKYAYKTNQIDFEWQNLQKNMDKWLNIPQSPSPQTSTYYLMVCHNW